MEAMPAWRAGRDHASPSYPARPIRDGNRPHARRTRARRRGGTPSLRRKCGTAFSRITGRFTTWDKIPRVGGWRRGCGVIHHTVRHVFRRNGHAADW
jgi:hypothetical protein